MGVVDYHADFLAGAAQLHRVRQRQSWFVSDRGWVGCGKAIIEQCCEPVWAKMDDHFVGKDVDLLDQGDEDDPHPQR